MSAWLNYIVEANFGLALFLAGYRLLLRRETDFRFQRMLLVTGMVASLLFPLVHVHDTQHASVMFMDRIIPSHFLPDPGVMGQDSARVPEESFAFWRYAAPVYLIGLLIGGLSMLFQLRRIIILIRSSKTRRIGKLRIAESTEDKPTFSFFHFIFIGRADRLSTDEKEQIIRHESVHARQMHSIDILLANLLKILFWFNPIITLYRKTLVEVHEFEADARTVGNTDAGRYCNLLAKVALQSTDFTLGSHFNQNLTVKRIAMIRSVKSKTALWKVALSAMLIPLTFLLLSCQDQFKNDGEVADKAFSSVDESATPPGGLEALNHTIRTQIRYPAEARAGHIYGKVALQFVVNEDGTLSDFQLLESPGKILGNEVIRVLSLIPRWTPARKDGVAVKQRMVLPITFKLDFPGQEKQITTKLENDEHHSSISEMVVVGYAAR